MGSRCLFVAGPDDQQGLLDYIRSLDLYLLPLEPGQEYTDDAQILCGCFISTRPESELRPVRTPGHDRLYYTDAVDPIIRLTRTVFKPPYLIPGNMFWNNNKPERAAITKPIFQKIARWIRKNWSKPEVDDWYFSPQAHRMVFEEGVICTDLVPGVEFTMIPVRDVNYDTYDISHITGQDP